MVFLFVWKLIANLPEFPSVRIFNCPHFHSPHIWTFSEIPPADRVQLTAFSNTEYNEITLSIC